MTTFRAQLRAPIATLSTVFADFVIATAFDRPALSDILLTTDSSILTATGINYGNEDGLFGQSHK